MVKTNIKIEKELAGRLKKRMGVGDTYESVIEDLLCIVEAIDNGQ